MRSIDSSKQGGTLQGERVVQTGREVVPLLPWGTTSPCLSQYLSNVGGPTKEYANKYTESRRLQIHVDSQSFLILSLTLTQQGWNIDVQVVWSKWG